MPIKLHLASDLHIDTYDFDFNQHVGHWADYDLVVIAGDIANSLNLTTWFLTKAAITFPHVTLLFVAGNHDFYFTSKPELFRELQDIDDRHPNFTHLKVGTIYTYMGYAFLGDTLWTDFKYYEDKYQPQEDWYYLATAERRMSDYRCILKKELPTKQLKTSFEAYVHAEWGGKAGIARDFLTENQDYYLHAADIQKEHYEQREWILVNAKRLAEQGYKVAVVTHHLPHKDSLDGRYAFYNLDHCYASEILGKEELPIKYWFHGHSHTPSDYEVLGTRVIAEPTGYAPPQRRQQSFLLELE